MEFFKNILTKIKEPKGWPLALFYFLFVGVLTATIVLVCLIPEQSVVHYCLYPFAGIGLVYFVYTIVYFSPKIKHTIISTLRKYKFTSTMLDNYGYRTIIFSIVSFVLNVSYVTFMAVLAIMTRSAWYISITAYYLVLILMKGNVFYSKKKYNTEEKQARAYRFCGIMFMLLTVAFSGIIVLIYTSNMYFEYAGLLIYAVAAYTFYRLILAIYNIFKARRQDDLYIQSIRSINLASALVSVVVLQVAMFQAFSPEHNTGIANGLTGGVVSVIILALGIFMIVTANIRLRELERKNGRQE